jgi:hypothetical protein
MKRTSTARRLKILSIDIGGSHVKLLCTGHAEPRKTPSGKDLTPTSMVSSVKKLTADWDYDAVSIGYPGITGRNGPAAEPGNLGHGWVGFDFSAAFERPVKVLNDAAMQALGSYEGGRMLFMGLGTGVGGALIADRVIVSLELGDLPWKKGRESIGEVLSQDARARLGDTKWQEVVVAVASSLMKAFLVDALVVGGGNAKQLDLDRLPHGIRRSHNLMAFRGGFRVWGVEDLPTLEVDAPPEARKPLEWRLV